MASFEFNQQVVASEDLATTCQQYSDNGWDFLFALPSLYGMANQYQRVDKYIVVFKRTKK